MNNAVILSESKDLQLLFVTSGLTRQLQMAL